MNIKLKAALNTAKILSLCTLGALVLNYIIYSVPVQYTIGGLMLFAMGMAVKLCYDSEKSKLEALERLNGTK